MEMMETNLDTIIQEKPELIKKIKIIQYICNETALSLSSLHQYGAIHRDIKSENILVI